MKKFAYLLTISLIAGSLFTGCGNGSSSSTSSSSSIGSTGTPGSSTGTPGSSTGTPGQKLLVQVILTLQVTLILQVVQLLLTLSLMESVQVSYLVKNLKLFGIFTSKMSNIPPILHFTHLNYSFKEHPYV